MNNPLANGHENPQKRPATAMPSVASEPRPRGSRLFPYAGWVMGKLKALPGPLARLATGLGHLPAPQRSASAERATYSPWRKLYNTSRWRSLRMKIFMRDGFTCQWPGCGHVEGNTSLLVADHRQPHRGDERLFWDEGNLWTLCKPHHDGAKQRVERAGRAG